jgi:hypothetical protein
MYCSQFFWYFLVIKFLLNSLIDRNHIKQNFEFGNDIAMAIIHQKPITTKIWKPTILFGRNSDQELKEIEDKQFQIEFKADYNHYHQGLCILLGQMRQGDKNKI